MTQDEISHASNIEVIAIQVNNYSQYDECINIVCCFVLLKHYMGYTCHEGDAAESSKYHR